MEYVDLGLPSGTLWAEENEEGHYTFNDAVSKYGNRLPTFEQLEELKDHCKWEWIGDGYRVTGPNGNAIVLPTMGYRGRCAIVNNVSSYGFCWSFTPRGSDFTWYLCFNFSGVHIYDGIRSNALSVRLVK